MIAALWVLSLLAALTVLGFQRATGSVMTLGILCLLALLTLLTHPGMMTLFIIGGVGLLLVGVFHFRPLRRWLISGRVMRALARQAPEFSVTEQGVLEAGNVGWEAELFRGMPDLEKLVDMPWVRLSPTEQAFLDGPVEELCAMLQPWLINQSQQIPDQVWNHLKHQGYFGLVIPTKYGGLGFSSAAHAQVIMKLASVSTAVATIASVPNSLGPAELLLHYGDEEQKNYYLPRLARGEEIPCFALTSPVAGSDASAIVDSGVVCRVLREDRETLAIRLNWNKRYITLAPVASLLGLAFQLYDPEHLLGDRESLGITCALIPANMPGVQIGRCHLPLRCAFPNGPIQGVDVIVGFEAIIGGIHQAGKGWQMLMERLAAGRGISLPSITMGGIKIAAGASGVYARTRIQFNRYIGEFGGVQEALARIAGNAYIAESLRFFTLAQIDQGIYSATAAAISKYHVTELSREVIRAAMDIHGGKAICLGPHNYLAQLHIESPIAMTVEGANILTRSLMIFGQGSLRCHPFLLQEIQAARQNNVKKFDRAFFSHLNYLWGNQIRAFVLGLTHGRMGSTVTSYYYRQLSRLSAIFAVVADILLITNGRALKQKELLSARLGDLLSCLYMISAILKHHHMKGESADLAVLTDWAYHELSNRFQRRLNELLANVPGGLLERWLRWVTFPLGKCFHAPSDQLTIAVAQSLLTPGAVRECLGEGAYFGGPLSDLEKKLQLIIAAEPLLKKIRYSQRQGEIRGYNLGELIVDAHTKKVITADEVAQIQMVEELRMQMVNVDDFENVHG